MHRARPLWDDWPREVGAGSGSIVPTASAWRGTSAFLDVRNIHGGHLSDLAGDAQGVGNIDGPDGSAVHELWIQHNFQRSGVSLLGGVYDLNSEFDRVQAAGLFLNSSFGVTSEFAESGGECPGGKHLSSQRERRRDPVDQGRDDVGTQLPASAEILADAGA